MVAENLKVIGLVMAVASLMMFGPATAATPTKSIPDLQKQKVALEQKIKDDQAAKKAKQDEQAKLAAQLQDLDGQITGVKAKISDTQTSLQTTQTAITQKQQEITEKQQELTVEQGHEAETLREIYESGHSSTLETLVGSASLSDVLVYHDYLDALEGKIQGSIDAINQIKASLEDAKLDLEHKRNDLVSLQHQQEAYQKALDGQQAEKNQLLANAKVAESQIAQEITDAQSVYADVNSELAKLQEAARQRALQIARGEIPKGTSNIGIGWPVDYRYVSTEFGDRTPFQAFHTGIDLVNYAGTPVTAAGDGVVTHIGRLTYGYGNFVVITHNDRYATLYGHFQGFADGLGEGQTVKRGDLLGYMGTTGWSTGPHLHFEVRDYGVPVNPRDYLP